MTTYVSGLVNPGGMAFDSAGTLYVSDYDTRTILRVASGGSQTVFAVLPIGPTGLVFDIAGRLYASHLYRNSITRISHDGTQRELFASGVPSPHTLAFDARGNMFVSESNVDSRTISVVASDGFIYQFSNAFIWPTGLVFDSSGTLYVAHYGSGEISRVKILYPK